MFTFPGSPDDYIRDTILTLSPQISCANFLIPTIPATIGPVLHPIRISKTGNPYFSFYVLFTLTYCFVKSWISRFFLFGSHDPMNDHFLIRWWLFVEKYPGYFVLSKLIFQFPIEGNSLSFISINFRFIYSAKIKCFFTNSSVSLLWILSGHFLNSFWDAKNVAVIIFYVIIICLKTFVYLQVCQESSLFCPLLFSPSWLNISSQ